MISPFSTAGLASFDTGEPLTRSDYDLWVNGQLWTEHAAEIEVEFTGDVGASRVSFVSREPMSGMACAPVSLTLRDSLGPEVEYFAGRLAKPMPDPPTMTSKAVALGPFSQMTLNYFGEEAAYRGWSVARVLYDIGRRAFISPGVLRVMGGSS